MFWQITTQIDAKMVLHSDLILDSSIPKLLALYGKQALPHQYLSGGFASHLIPINTNLLATHNSHLHLNSHINSQFRQFHSTCSTYLNYSNPAYNKANNDPTLDRSSQNYNTDKLILKKNVENQSGTGIPKYPIVLCHGFSGFAQLFVMPDLAKSLKSNFYLKDDLEPTNDEIKIKGGDEENRKGKAIGLFKYWNGISDTLIEKGCQVLVAKVPPFDTIETRANSLNDFITSNLNELRDDDNDSSSPIKVNLIAHSMGGLDCRYLISKLEKHGYEVVSLTTISTPHRGTSASDFAVKIFPSSFLKAYFPSVSQMSLESAENFNRQVPNDPKVKYYSYGACFTPSPVNFFYVTWQIVFSREGENDGLISLKSCKWGKYLGYLENVDHLDLINWMGGLTKFRNYINGSEFDPVDLYLDILDNLSKDGL